jgi:D-beta-D-heptose 7-phosphate kinase/D-beta-D-heptose 1-phosphate adenosyltransferase
MDTREKILSRAGLHEVLEEHRRSGRKIVFAHGVFDILHAGHIRYLQAARAEGDLLVVAIHSDAAARKLKGPGRPVLTERARALLVAALGAVDYALVFDEADVMPLIREFQPDVHARSARSPTATHLIGELPAHGVRAAVVASDSPHSTTALIDRVRRSVNGD